MIPHIPLELLLPLSVSWCIIPPCVCVTAPHGARRGLAADGVRQRE